MIHTVPFKSKLPSRETSLVSRVLKQTRWVSRETAYPTRESTGSINTSHSSVFETCFVKDVNTCNVSIGTVDNRNGMILVSPNGKM